MSWQAFSWPIATLALFRNIFSSLSSVSDHPNQGGFSPITGERGLCSEGRFQAHATKCRTSTALWAYCLSSRNSLQNGYDRGRLSHLLSSLGKAMSSRLRFIVLGLALPELTYQLRASDNSKWSP